MTPPLPVPFWTGPTLCACASLDEDDRRLLQLGGPVTDPLQFADVPVGDPVAPAHGFGPRARAYARLGPAADGNGSLHSVRYYALHTLRAAAVPGAAAPFALSGRAHGTAGARVQCVPGQAVRRDGRAPGLVALLRAAGGRAPGPVRLRTQGRTGQRER